jgi:hypothetical protein
VDFDDRRPVKGEEEPREEVDDELLRQDYAEERDRQRERES